MPTNTVFNGSGENSRGKVERTTIDPRGYLAQPWHHPPENHEDRHQSAEPFQPDSSLLALVAMRGDTNGPFLHAHDLRVSSSRLFQDLARRRGHGHRSDSRTRDVVAKTFRPAVERVVARSVAQEIPDRVPEALPALHVVAYQGPDDRGRVPLPRQHVTGKDPNPLAASQTTRDRERDRFPPDRLLAPAIRTEPHHAPLDSALRQLEGATSRGRTAIRVRACGSRKIEIARRELPRVLVVVNCDRYGLGILLSRRAPDRKGASAPFGLSWL